MTPVDLYMRRARVAPRADDYDGRPARRFPRVDRTGFPFSFRERDDAQRLFDDYKRQVKR